MPLQVKKVDQADLVGCGVGWDTGVASCRVSRLRNSPLMWCMWFQGFFADENRRHDGCGAAFSSWTHSFKPVLSRESKWHCLFGVVFLLSPLMLSVFLIDLRTTENTVVRAVVFFSRVQNFKRAF